MKTAGVLVLVATLAAAPLAARQAQGAQPAPKQQPAKRAPAATTGQKGPDAALLKPGLLTAKAPEEFTVRFVTTQGEIAVKVTRAWAPRGADRFYNLAKHHFYDGAAFFRVLSGFVVQFGLSPYPQVSAAWESATIKDDPVTKSNTRGMITFATGGPNTRTTQVFINLGNNARLDSDGFSPFGEVTEGMDVIEKLYGGYGEGAPRGRGPDQGLIQTKGSAYLEKDFPKLDKILSTKVEEPAKAAPAKAPSKAPAKQPS